MRKHVYAALTGVSLLVLSAPAFAQSAASEEGASSGDIVVQARRKDESIQDVPLTVNAVSSETIEKLNIRDMKDIAAVVPGLTLTAGNRTTGSVSAMRGLNFDNNSSGNNGTVEFYLNDAPISAGVVLQSLYDIGQIEVLRGPQGTLRGKASPSGSITLTTRRADVDEWGGYVQGTVNTIGGINANGALNIPVIPGMLGLRVAGLVDNSELGRTKSINNPSLESSAKTRAVRVSLRFTPTNTIDVNASYSHLVKNSIVWDQVESANIADSTAAASPTLITAKERLAVSDVANNNHQGFDIFNWQAQWSFAGQRLNYVGSVTKQDNRSTEPWDKGNLFDNSYPGNASLPNNNGTYATFASTLNPQNMAQASHTYPKQQTHELRLSSDERVLGMFDYVIGGFINKLEPWTDLVSIRSTNFSGGVVSPATFTGFTPTPTVRRGRTIERAVFGNVTAHIGEATEISGGARYLNYQENLNGANNSFKTTIWSASVKHRFSDDIMVYASAGSSFRVGSGTNGLILSRSITQSKVVDPFLASLLPITPETSKSYEVGLRTTWMDKKILLNITYFHQDFKGYIFPVAPFLMLENTGTLAAPAFTANPVVGISTISAPVPAKVDGVEAELSFRPNDNFNLGMTMAYAKSKMSNALIPCSPTPTGPGGTTTIADVQGGVANRQVAQCTVNQSAGRAAPFSASLQTEYTRNIKGDMDGFVRGLVTFNGNSKNDPQNPYDDVKSYALANLYAGIRMQDGGLEVSLYAKNIFNTFRVVDRSRIPASVATSLGSRFSSYRVISTTEPREFGISARYSFGSR